jgi:hypothetical protein
MSATEVRRPLEDMISELVEGLFTLPTSDIAGVRLSEVEVALPVETRVVGGPSGPVVHADMPSLRTRTDFDLPVGRLVVRLAALPMEVRP